MHLRLWVGFVAVLAASVIGSVLAMRSRRDVLTLIQYSEPYRAGELALTAEPWAGSPGTIAYRCDTAERPRMA